jgi:peptidyl-prolyl cis-trans isomerase A (cyclophilin A)
MSYAIIETTKGSMLAFLDDERAPNTAGNFKGLATGSKTWTDPKTGKSSNDPYYDGLSIHRVAPGFVIQGGCPEGTGRGGPGFHIDLEIHPELRHDKAGVLSMARASDPNSAGSQFFVTLAATPFLDDNYAVFGHVIDGLDVVDALGNTPVRGGGKDGPPAEALTINKVTIIEGSEEEARAQFGK